MAIRGVRHDGELPSPTVATTVVLPNTAAVASPFVPIGALAGGRLAVVHTTPLSPFNLSLFSGGVRCHTAAAVRPLASPPARLPAGDARCGQRRAVASSEPPRPPPPTVSPQRMRRGALRFPRVAASGGGQVARAPDAAALEQVAPMANAGSTLSTIYGVTSCERSGDDTFSSDHGRTLSAPSLYFSPRLGLPIFQVFAGNIRGGDTEGAATS